MNTSTTTYKSRLLVDYIHKHADSTKRPLMVSMQGPQGCGKSTLAAALVADLASKGLRTAVASLDGELVKYNAERFLSALYRTQSSRC
jgi:pantothenate kinase-related protein Tda10